MATAAGPSPLRELDCHELRCLLLAGEEEDGGGGGGVFATSEDVVAEAVLAWGQEQEKEDKEARG